MITELRILYFTLGLITNDKVRNKRVREVLGIRLFNEKTRE